MASVERVLMSEDSHNFSGFSKTNSIWGNRPSSSAEEKAWSQNSRSGLSSGLFNPLSQFGYGPQAFYGRPSSAPGPPVAATPAPSNPSTAHAHTHPVESPSSTSSSSANPLHIDDDLIPTAIVVKNIPFAIKKEQLVEVMTHLNLPLPYAFNYHFDNGVFRGLAFANFSTAEETAIVIGALNGREIGGRKLRVEYKKMLPLQERERIEREKRERRGQLEEQHVSQSQGSSLASSPLSAHSVPVSAPYNPTTPVDMNDKDTLELYTSLVLFSSSGQPEVVLSGATLRQSQILRTLCNELGLNYSERNNVPVISQGILGPAALGLGSGLFRQ